MLTKDQLKSIKFINLKSRTSYSLMMAIGTVEATIEKCYEKGHAGVCITDNGNMMGCLDLYNKSRNKDDFLKKHNIPLKVFPSVMGVVLSLIEDSFVKSKLLKTYPITLYVKNFEGYENICELVSMASIEEKFYSKPRIDFEDLVKFKKGLIATSGGCNGLLYESILNQNSLFIKDVLFNIIKNKDLSAELIDVLVDFTEDNKYVTKRITGIMQKLSLDEEQSQIFYSFFGSNEGLSFILDLIGNTRMQEIFCASKDVFPISRVNLDKIKELTVEDSTKDLLIKILGMTTPDHILTYFKNEFGDDFYLEMNASNMKDKWNKTTGTYDDIGYNPQDLVNKKMVEYSEKYGIKIILVQDSYLLNRDDHIAQSIMLWNRPGSAKDKFYFNEALYVMTVEEFYEKVQSNYEWITDEQFIEWCENSIEILDKCKDLEISFRPSLPIIKYESHYVNKVPVIIKRDLMIELQDAGLWNEQLKQKIKDLKSIQEIDEIPKSIKEKFIDSDSVIDFRDMELREKENVYLENVLNRIEDYYKKDEPEFSRIFKRSRKDIQLRTALKVIVRNKKLLPKEIDVDRIQLEVDKKNPDKKIDVRQYDKKVLNRFAVKHGFFKKEFNEMDLFGDKKIRDQLIVEINTIQYNGIVKLISYFMLLEDVSNFVKENNYLRGFGRGSGAGSFVAYSLDITDVKPTEYKLFFERFLTRERIGAIFLETQEYPFSDFIKNSPKNEIVDYDGKYEELLSMIQKDKITDEIKEWVDDELFFLECNYDYLTYVLNAKKALDGKNIENENNSVIFYLLGLTDKCPKKRVKSIPTTLPDIDYDTNARDPIKEYLIFEYGKDHVTLLGTFGTLKLKGAIKDVIRQLEPDMSFEDTNNLTKLLDEYKETEGDDGRKYFDGAMAELPEFKRFFDDKEHVKEAVYKLLGEVKTTGIHAGGIVVSGKKVVRVVPCKFERDEKMWVTQPDMQNVEWAGLIKYDILGLNTLNDILRCFRLVEKRHGVVLNYANIPVDDPNVIKKFKRGETTAIFQFGTFLAHSILIQLKEISSVQDLSIITSIARPGPLNMGMDKTFIRRVNKEDPIVYFHKSLEPILQDTYGIVVFQESVMEIVKVLGGLTGNESVVVLKAMGKKDLQKLMKFKEKFIKTAIAKYPEMAKVSEFEHPITKSLLHVSLAEKIWLFLEAFAEYGFNKSHAIAYSIVSYICMYLSHYYPIEWITAVLMGAKKEDFKEFYVKWSQHTQKPDINNSKKEYSIEKVNGQFKAVMPFSVINGFGEKGDFIIAKQPFTSFADFLNRIEHSKINKTNLLNLIYAGVFDSFKTTDNKIEPVFEFRKNLIREFFDFKIKVKKASKKDRLDMETILNEIKDMGRGKFLKQEIDLLNITAFNYLEFYKDQMTTGCIKFFGTAAISPETALMKNHKELVVVGGAVKSKRVFPIKNGTHRGKEMAIITIMNDGHEIKVTVFSDKLEKDINGRNPILDLDEYMPIIVKGRIKKSDKFPTSIDYEACWVLE